MLTPASKQVVVINIVSLIPFSCLNPSLFRIVSIDKNNSQEQPSQKEEKTDSKVKTGDTSTIAMWIVTLLSALSGMIFIKKKDMIK